MIGFMEDVFALRIDKVCNTYDVRLLESRNDVGIHKPTIEHCDVNAATTIARTVHAVTLMHVKLVIRHSLLMNREGVEIMDVR